MQLAYMFTQKNRVNFKKAVNRHIEFLFCHKDEYNYVLYKKMGAIGARYSK